MAPRVGDLVVCSSKSFRDDAGIGRDVGMYMVDRRRDGLVLFPSLDRSAWIPTRALEVVAPDDQHVTANAATWLVLVHRVMRLVDATDIQLEQDDDGVMEARIGCGGLDVPLLDALAELLGPTAPSLRLIPGSMSRVLVVFPIAPPKP